MPQQLLDAPQIRARIQQMGGETVPQLVRAYAERDSAQSQILFQHQIHRLLGDPRAPDAPEKWTARHRRLLPISLDRPHCGASHRDDPFFPALSKHFQNLVHEIQVLHIESQQLGNPQSGGVEQLQYRRIPILQPRRPLPRRLRFQGHI